MRIYDEYRRRGQSSGLESDFFIAVYQRRLIRNKYYVFNSY